MIQKSKFLFRNRNILLRFVKVVNGNIVELDEDERHRDLSDRLPVGETFGHILLASEASVWAITFKKGAPLGLILIDKHRDQIIPVLPSVTTAADIKRHGADGTARQRIGMLSEDRLMAATDSRAIRFLQNIPEDFEADKERYLSEVYRPLSIKTLKLNLQQIIAYARMVLRAVGAAA